MSFDEQLVIYFANQSQCAGKNVPLPPPDACDSWVHGMYWASQYHLISISIVFLFLAFLVQLTVTALDKGEH